METQFEVADEYQEILKKILEETHYVYQIKNVISGQTYVGSTVKIPTTRWAQHLSQLKHKTHISKLFQEAWNKDDDLTHWQFNICYAGKNASNRYLKQLEADFILQIPSNLRLNMPNRSTTTRQKYLEVIRGLKKGERHIDIEAKTGVSASMISRINKEYFN